MMKGRIAQVNAELKRLGFAERLRRGRGYHYFHGGEAHEWFTSSVYTNDANAFSVEQWIAEYYRLSGKTPHGKIH